MMRIGIIGAGFVGLVTGACLAKAGNHVTIVERDAARVAMLAAGGVPFHEPGLPALIKETVGAAALRFTTDVAELADVEAAFIAVGTPPKADGSSDLSMVFAAADGLAKVLPDRGIVVIRSTVPPGTNAALQAHLENAGRPDLAVVSAPEFLAEGTAVKDFQHPNRLVFGGEPAATLRVASAFSGLDENAPRIHTTWATAELVKYAANTFLASRVSLINEFARLCDTFDGDVTVLARAVGLDDRIGAKFLRAGIGYGGSCFPKDVQAIAAAGTAAGLALEQVPAVHAANEQQWQYTLERAAQWVGGFDGKTVGVWGISFKPDTDDVREAPSLRVIAALEKAGAKVQAHDPLAKGPHQVPSPLEAAQGADLVLHVTEWPEYGAQDWTAVAKAMATPRIFDCRNTLPHGALSAAGIAWRGVGVNPGSQRMHEVSQ